jgi:hypothetical protein
LLILSEKQSSSIRFDENSIHFGFDSDSIIRFDECISGRNIQTKQKEAQMSIDVSLEGAQFLYVGVHDPLTVVNMETRKVQSIRAEYYLRIEAAGFVFVAPYYSEYVLSGLTARDLEFCRAFVSDKTVKWFLLKDNNVGTIVPLPKDV